MRWILTLLVVISCSKSKGNIEDLSFQTIDGRIYRWKDIKGKVLVVDFWATWCEPCRKSIPELNTLYERYKGEVLVVGFSKDDSPDVVFKFMKDVGISYPVAMSNSKLERKFGGILGLPTTFIIDRNGNITRRFMGYVPLEVLEQNVRLIL